MHTYMHARRYAQMLARLVWDVPDWAAVTVVIGNM